MKETKLNFDISEDEAMFLMASNGENIGSNRNSKQDFMDLDHLIHRKGAKDGSDADVKHDYFMWLCKQVELNSAFDPKSEEFSTNPANPSYFHLAQMLFNKEFVPIVPFDENRAVDGQALRYWYANLHSCFNDYSALNGPCNLLEMMVALAQRIDRELMIGPEFDDRSALWFWEMLGNLDISKYDDAHFTPENSVKISHILDNLVDRNYGKMGQNSLFPMRKSKRCVTKNGPCDKCEMAKSVTHNPQKRAKWDTFCPIGPLNCPIDCDENVTKLWQKLDIWGQMHRYFQEFHIKIGKNW